MIKKKGKRSEIHAKLKRQKKIEKHAKSKARDVAVKSAIEIGEEVRSLSLSHWIAVVVLIFDLLFLFLISVFCFCVVVASGEKAAEDDRRYKLSWWNYLQAILVMKRLSFLVLIVLI